MGAEAGGNEREAAGDEGVEETIGYVVGYGSNEVELAGGPVQPAVFWRLFEESVGFGGNLEADVRGVRGEGGDKLVPVREVWVERVRAEGCVGAAERGGGVQFVQEEFAVPLGGADGDAADDVRVDAA